MQKLGLTTVILFTTAAVLAQNGGRVSKAQSELVEAERNFARYSVENGQREAWLAFFADDGIMFQPGPVNAKEVMSKRPATAKPPPVTLNWQPIYGDISRAGDLGYNLGPWKITDQTEQKRPDLYGYFFSVWRQQTSGEWKVVLDLGIRVTAATADHSFQGSFTPAERPKARLFKSGDKLPETMSLTELDVAAAKSVDAYLARIHPEARVLRAGSPPSAGPSAVREFTSGKEVTLVFTPAHGGQSSSDDLGYTFGSYEIREGGRSKEQGYYAHMWKRDESGKWRIVLANLSANPPKAAQQ
jgi:ketosteroid isomerase-like protein